MNFANNIDPIIETAMLSALAANSNAAQKVQWQTVNDRFAIDIPYLWLDVTFAVWAAQPKVQNWANAHAPTTGDVKSVTSVISPDGGDLEWAEIWV